MALPGLLVNIQFPAGKPFKTTLPVAVVQVGWVMIPTVGAEGVVGCALITTFAEAREPQLGSENNCVVGIITEVGFVGLLHDNLDTAPPVPS